MNIYYHAALKAITGQINSLLRDFRSVQKQTSQSSRQKTADSISQYCTQSIAKILFSTTQYGLNSANKTYWHVKAIDGADNFCTGNPMFSVSVALVEDGQVNFAMTSIPVMGRIFYASPGEGVLSYSGEYSTKHSCSRNTQINPKYIISESVCTSIDYAYVACGNLDAAILELDEVEMKIASLFVTEGGGKVSRVGRKLIMSNQFIHDDLRSNLIGKADTTVSFCCGPTTKSPAWESAIYQKALVGRSHRSPEGVQRIQEVQQLIRDVLGIPKDYAVLLVNGSATGAIESAFYNFLGHRPITNLSYDVFGRRWAGELKRMTDQINLNILLTNIEYEIGRDYEKHLDLGSDLVFVYTGTSTGIRWPGELNKILPKWNGLTVCDATSALFGEADFPWQSIDVTCGSFQKALGAEAGLGLIVLSPKALQELEQKSPVFISPRFLDLHRFIKYLERGELNNTISMLNIEEILVNLRWAQENGGIHFLNKRCLANQEEILDQIAHSSLEVTVPKEYRACTVLCARPKNPANRTWEYVRKIAKDAAKMGVFEIAGHPEEEPCLRFWTGPTLNPHDVRSGIQTVLKLVD